MGVSWIPARWFCMLENGDWGRDYAVNLGRRLSQITYVSCVETNRAFAEYPLFRHIAAVVPVIANLFQKKERELVEWYDPALLKLESTKQLWKSLFSIVQRDGTIRYDIASSLAAFFSDQKQFLVTDSLDKAAWNNLYNTLNNQTK
jgi:hypothetical protein